MGPIRQLCETRKGILDLSPVLVEAGDFAAPGQSSVHEKSDSPGWKCRSSTPFRRGSSPVLTGAPLEVRHGGDNGYVGSPVCSGAPGTREACLRLVPDQPTDRECLLGGTWNAQGLP
jgi:hypothetical protein